jgi:hypothetical protein
MPLSDDIVSYIKENRTWIESEIGIKGKCFIDVKGYKFKISSLKSISPTLEFKPRKLKIK